MIADDRNPFVDAALRYAARGWHVFPLFPDAKQPATPSGFKDATRRTNGMTSLLSPDESGGPQTSSEDNGLLLPARNMK